MAQQLPKAFGLKLSLNDKYLAFVTEDNKAKDLLKFYADDLNEWTAVFEWEPAKSGGDNLVHLKCTYNNKYWVRRESDHGSWIAAEGNKPDENIGSLTCTLFEVRFKGDGSSIKLKHAETGYYIVAYPTEDDLDLCLYESGPNPSPGFHDTFSVVELSVPVSTEISDVKFRLADAKINNPTTDVFIGTTRKNDDQDSNKTMPVELAYTLRKSSIWKLAGSSLTSDLKINSAIPIILNNGKVELSGDEVMGLYLDSGEPLETEVTDKTTYKVIIPPKSRVVVTISSTRASADVPFSYTERITYADGRETTRDKDDGIFTRFNHYDFKYETRVVKNA